MTYNATLASGQALPSFIKFDAASRTFTVHPESISSAQTLDFKVTGSVTPQLSASFTWTLVAVDPPQVSLAYFQGSVNLPPISTQLHVGTQLEITSPSFLQLYQLSEYEFVQDSRAQGFASFGNGTLTLKPGAADNGRYKFFFYSVQSRKYL